MHKLANDRSTFRFSPREIARGVTVPATSPATSPDLRIDPVETRSQILPAYRGTAIGQLLATHNLGHEVPRDAHGELLIITCMDHRVSIEVPPYFAYQLRTAGASPRPIISNVAYAVAVDNVRAICVIGHTDCTMCTVNEQTDELTETLISRERWSLDDAYDQASVLERAFHIRNPVDAAWVASRQLAELFPSCLVAPLLYSVDDGSLMQITDRPLDDDEL